tara:strand:+ start:508 stop:783 length:276 start_codon:yes stop_codon:yes gene_type:complete
MLLDVVQFKDYPPSDEIQCVKCKTSYTYEEYKILAGNFKLLFVEARPDFPVCNLCFLDFVRGFLKKTGQKELKVSFSGEKDLDFLFKATEL